MSKEYTKNDAILAKKKAFKKLNTLLESFINKPLPTNDKEVNYVKKAILISKWIEQYVNYISFEEKFDPAKNINYKRGDIVFVNFGFGVGSEFGGSHYAAVLDKNNKHSASSITVIPLSSYKNTEVYDRDVYLGNELYEKMQLKLKTQTIHLRDAYTSNSLLLKLLQEKIDIPDKSDSNYEEIDQLIQELNIKQNLLSLEISDAERIRSELENLKQGSVAKIEQIRTISKMRIYNPKNTRDPLYGIRFSESTMKKINSKIKELYIFEE